MLGLKSFQTAAVLIGGIELAEKIKKGQFKLGKLGGRTATIGACTGPASQWAAMAEHFQRPGWFTKNVFNRLVARLTGLGISVAPNATQTAPTAWLAIS